VADNISRRTVILTAAAGLVLPDVARSAQNADLPLPNTLVRLSSNEFFSLRTFVCVEAAGRDSINVTMASGSQLNFANADDVKLIRQTLHALATAKQLLLFEPNQSTIFNLSQVTNVWNNQEGFRFWGMDGLGRPLPEGLDAATVWETLCTLCKDNFASAGLLQVTPELIVNTFHAAHISTVDGKLRFHMSNKSWPIIESIDQSKNAQATLDAAMK
jgi:hypothetical protein